VYRAGMSDRKGGRRAVGGKPILLDQYSPTGEKSLYNLGLGGV